jgi:hypothetical protein
MRAKSSGRRLPCWCRLVPVLAVSGLLAGCSTGSAQVAEPSALNIAPPSKAAAPSSSPSLLPQFGPKVKARDADATYQLTPDEQKLDCKKLTGKMQVRILQMRDQRERTLTSTASQLIQRGVVPVLGGSPHGANPGEDIKRDRAWLEAYNAQLAAKKCPTYDLENELQPRSIRDTPQPVPNAAQDPSSSKNGGKTKN